MKQATKAPQSINSVVNNIDKYSQEDLKVLFKGINPYLLQRWMDHFAREEKYEVCQVIRDVMAEHHMA